jgi:hypothetical protein
MSASADSWLLFVEAEPAPCQAPLHGSGTRPDADTVLVLLHPDYLPRAQYVCLQMMAEMEDEEMLSG